MGRWKDVECTSELCSEQEHKLGRVEGRGEVVRQCIPMLKQYVYSGGKVTRAEH